MSLKDAHAPIIGGVKRSVTPSAGYHFFILRTHWSARNAWSYYRRKPIPCLDQMNNDATERSVQEIEKSLLETYGAIVGGARLASILGYPSVGAFRQALRRGRLPVTVLPIAGRRGKFAQVYDIAVWLHNDAARFRAASSLMKQAHKEKLMT